jgi:hypothetical protein
MPISRDFTAIDKKLSTFTSKDERIFYLHRCLFQRKKKLAEFKRGDLEILEILRIKTKDDYEKCLDQEFHGSLFPYFHPSTDAATAKRLGLKNIELLIRRLELEFDYKRLCEEIEIFEGKIIEIEHELTNKDTSKITRLSLNKTLKAQPEDKGKTLCELWKSSNEHYKKVISYLEEKNSTYHRAWVKREEGDLIWLGTKAQARAFVKVCRNKNFIDPTTPGKTIILVINSTFKNLNIPIGSISEWVPNASVNPKDLEEFDDVSKII